MCFAPFPRVLMLSTRKCCRVVAFVFFFVVVMIQIPIECFQSGSGISQSPASTAFCGESQPNAVYKVCNGFSNQLLGHAAYISRSIQNQNSMIRIPDAFIINGVQSEFDGRKGLKSIFPSKNNSVPLSSVIDLPKLLQVIQKHGINSCLVPHENVVSFSYEKEECPWLDELKQSDDELSLEVLNAMKPAPGLALVIESVFRNLMKLLNSLNLLLSDGICLHHRNGDDWNNHCRIWKGNNCLESEGRLIGDLVFDRIPSEYKRKWIYYVSDDELDETLLLQFGRHGLKLIDRDKDDLLSGDDMHHFLKDVGVGMAMGNYRDILAAVDFFMCDYIDSFIGNSVSTFSALQIAKRAGRNSSWYNSRSIPLAGSFSVYHPPIIYTYTELSQQLGKSLLKASILSVRRVFGLKIEINVIYHGCDDIKFLSWMKSQNVIIHHHKPLWLSIMEKMRVHLSSHVSEESLSHLFGHSGNYLGTWQRIDIPLFVNAEYALFLDADTIVHDSFTLAEFGSDITRGIAFSNEVVEDQLLPINAGVALLNIPKLRQTYDSFIDFICRHNKTNFLMGPSDQGAYLGFYGNAEKNSTRSEFYQHLAINKDSSTLSFLDTKFNFKPYYRSAKNLKERKIIHFHGLKPHDILHGLMGASAEDYPLVLRPLLNKVLHKGCAESVCQAMHDFSLSLVADDENFETYCNISFHNGGSLEKVPACTTFFNVIASEPRVDCFALAKLLSHADTMVLQPTNIF